MGQSIVQAGIWFLWQYRTHLCRERAVEQVGEVLGLIYYFLFHYFLFSFPALLPWALWVHPPSACTVQLLHAGPPGRAGFAVFGLCENRE
jgi:hypothetical protein